jgi:hypothetical protein
MQLKDIVACVGTVVIQHRLSRSNDALQLVAGQSIKHLHEFIIA